MTIGVSMPIRNIINIKPVYDKSEILQAHVTAIIEPASKTQPLDSIANNRNRRNVRIKVIYACNCRFGDFFNFISKCRVGRNEVETHHNLMINKMIIVFIDEWWVSFSLYPPYTLRSLKK
jgi:hypothetical protein